jgi:hypothetical protein
MNEGIGILKFFPENAMEELFYGKYNVLKEKSYPQHACNDHLYEVTATSGINI